jgi:hypothetical protein
MSGMQHDIDPSNSARTIAGGHSLGCPWWLFFASKLSLFGNALTCLRGFVCALVVYQATRNCSVFSLLSVLLFPARDLFGRCIWFLLPEYVTAIARSRLLEFDERSTKCIWLLIHLQQVYALFVSDTVSTECQHETWRCISHHNTIYSCHAQAKSSSKCHSSMQIFTVHPILLEYFKHVRWCVRVRYQITVRFVCERNFMI